MVVALCVVLPFASYLIQELNIIILLVKSDITVWVLHIVFPVGGQYIWNAYFTLLQ